MNICIDARSPGTGGVLTYTTNILQYMFVLGTDHKFYLITDKGHTGWAQHNVEEILVPMTNPLGWMYWSNVVLPNILADKEIDIYHTLKHVTAFNVPGKKILTFHGAEMIYEFPHWYKKHDLIYWRSMYSLAGMKYDRILTATHAEADYFRSKKRLSEDLFKIIPFAANDVFECITDKYRLDSARSKLGLPDKFLLTVTRFHPIKNIRNQILAFAKAREHLKENYKFLIVGSNEGDHYRELLSLVDELNLKGKVIFYGRLEDDLSLVYNLADLFLFPSFYENFGLVLLEAMSCGAPVLTSNLPSIHETVGDAAIKIKPDDIQAISSNIVTLLNDPSLRSACSKNSIEQAGKFTWQKCASQTLHLYESIV